MNELLPGQAAFSAKADATLAARIITCTAMLSVAYLCVTVVPLTNYAIRSGSVLPIALHVIALVSAITSVARRGRSATWRMIRDWLPLALGPLLYIELRWIVAGASSGPFDNVVLTWEAHWFPSGPSHSLAERFAIPWLSEALHAAYASYYMLIYGPAIALYARSKRHDFAVTLLSLAITYAACFTIFAMFPVDGPRFLRGPAHAPAGPIRTAVLQLLAAASSRGTAFPSSHVAASVAASLCALRFQPVTGGIVAFATVLLTIATVYGGFHYGVDALAGLAIGVLCTLAAFGLDARLNRPSQNAMAPR